MWLTVYVTWRCIWNTRGALIIQFLEFAYADWIINVVGTRRVCCIVLLCCRPWPKDTSYRTNVSAVFGFAFGALLTYALCDNVCLWTFQTYTCNRSMTVWVCLCVHCCCRCHCSHMQLPTAIIAMWCLLTQRDAIRMGMSRSSTDNQVLVALAACGSW